MHANSASVSAFDGNLIVSIRHLSAVCSFALPPPPPGSDDATGGLRWCLSSELPGRSNFTFAGGDPDKFFNQHAVRPAGRAHR